MPERESNNPSLSPRISSLRSDLKSGNPSTLNTFWREITEQGTPIIESIEGDNEHVLVTFLWRESEPVENVVVIGEIVGEDVTRNRMERLAGTDLLYKTCRMRADLRTCYELSPNDPFTPFSEANDWDARTRTWQVDPLNPRRYRVNVLDEEDPKSKEKYLSVLELPHAPPQPWVKPRPDGLAGKLELHRFRSEVMGNERRVWVYTPPGHAIGGEPHALLVMTDAVPYTQIMAAPTSVDNLVPAGKIPPTVAVFVDNPDRWNDLACNPAFTDFLAQELVPWAREQYNATGDSAQTIIGGTSLGGLMAAFAGLRHPEVFGNVLSQSGAFQWSPGGEPEYEWLVRQFVEAPRLPVRFFLDAGLLETGHWPPNSPSLLESNRHMRNVLRAKGYSVHYLEYNGGHNYICWQGTLADGLTSLIGW